MPGPLHGIRIIELTSVVLGPWACQMLADMGADVIKIEPPRGDSNRTLGASRNPGMAALYLTCNRNKRSIVLDLKQPAARRRAAQAGQGADVFIHNNRPQVMTKLGLDYADLKAVNPEAHLLRRLRLFEAGPLRRAGRARRFHPGGQRHRAC